MNFSSASDICHLRDFTELAANDGFNDVLTYSSQTPAFDRTSLSSLVACRVKAPAEEAFAKLKSAFAMAPVLSRLNTEKPFILEMDTSSVGLSSAPHLGSLSFQHIFRLHGLPLRIVSEGGVHIHVPYYKNLVAFFYAVDEINKNPLILPNLTVGYHIYDSCSNPKKAIRSIIQILSGPGYLVPNYSCTRKKKVVGFIGDHFSSTTLRIAQLLGIYPYTQISYGATDALLSDRNLFPALFRTVPDDFTTYSVISHFFNYLGWNWVGIIASEDDAGNRETRLLTNLLASRGICVAFVLQCGDPLKYIEKEKEEIIREEIRKSSAKIIILCGTHSDHILSFLSRFADVIENRTFILNPNFSPLSFFNKFNNIPVVNLSLSFALDPGKVLDLESYLMNSSVLKNPEDILLRDVSIELFNCSTASKLKNEKYEHVHQTRLKKCKGTEPWVPAFKFMSYDNTLSMYQAVQSLASALHDMSISHGHQTDHQMHLLPHKVHRYLQAMMQLNESGTQLQGFPDKGQTEITYSVNNVIVTNRLILNTVGGYKISSMDGLTIWVHTKNIMWKNNAEEIPISRCSPRCLPGERKVTGSDIRLCCYQCAPCAEGEISNTSDSKNCMKCPEDSWPNENRTSCVLKDLEYLSYAEDIISIALFCLSLFFCIMTVLFLLIFVFYHNTPIVRANNKNLSFVLLVSIMLSFLCVFLFLGRPVDITCMLRQISTGIFLSVSISSLLAKTIMVYIAFKATRPGSVWRTWTGVRLPNCVLLICSSVQVVLCMSWVTLSPPFQELDTHSYKEKVVVQCNEGSELWFYSVLGYMGVLAAVSFITAFLARTLPDSFNEAKYITFSMLVFCSVWIAMIPAYLSTRGKYMVAVEIFAILTSNAGLLGCLFLPKCLIIIFKPELNTRKYILSN
ncbi:vomeronasal type-2 receptor 26-like [Engystomops pustulosus]|uniref:vomeronasal type-2 receptor 26-like n=1 Tax=Engystomops pustulosus TaxID=76066 RepID=UPI003AFB59E5